MSTDYSDGVMNQLTPLDAMRIAQPENNLDRVFAYETTVSLRFWSETLLPDEITQALGVQPQIASGKGESTAPSLAPPAPVGVWIYFLGKGRDRPLEAQILQLLQQLPQSLEVWHQLIAKHSGIISCALRFDQQICGQFLSAATLEQISQRRLAVDFDIRFDLAGSSEVLQ